MLFGVLKRHRPCGPSPNNWKHSPKEAPHHFQELGPLARAALMIRLSVSSGVKTTLQSNVQLDEMLAAEPYKSVRKVTTEQRWPTLFGCCPNPTDSANGFRLEEHDCN
jgi:hypothetical protein